MRLPSSLLACVALVTVVGTLSAQQFNPDRCQTKLLPGHGAKYDRFGVSVDLSGTVAIVGSDSDRVNGIRSGSAYLFDVASGQQIDKLLPNGGAKKYDYFGHSVGLSGETAIVGSPWDDDKGHNSGSAYLFDVTTGHQIAKLRANDGAAGDYFGISVAISSTTAIVGAWGNADNGIYSGSAYLFDITTGQQIVKLLPDDNAKQDRFGESVAISGTIAIVGAPFDDPSGSVYLFDVPTGLQIAKLLPNDGAGGDHFGISVAISSTTAIVGAYHDDDNGDGSGSAYLFDVATGQQISKLLPDDGSAEDRFGCSVGISGTTAIVGAQYSGDDNGFDSGSAYIFDTMTGLQIAKLLPEDGASEEWFGCDVAIRDATTIVGADGDDDNGPGSGSAYFIGLEPEDCNANGISDCRDIASGTSRDLNGNGVPDECDPIGTSYCGPAQKNSTGQPAVISAFGTTPVADNNVYLEASQLPPGQFGYFLNSQTKDFVPFPPGSQGSLCLGGAIGRHAKDVQDSGAAGALALVLDLTALPTPSGPTIVQPGETWNFQAWFRDQNPNATSNFTDGISILFQ